MTWILVCKFSGILLIVKWLLWVLWLTFHIWWLKYVIFVLSFLRSYACLNKLPHINGSFNYSIILFCTNSFVFQLFDLSGILTVFFCGIVMSHYTWHSMTDGSKVTTKWVNQIPKQPHLFLMYCGKNYLYLWHIVLCWFQAFLCNIFVHLWNMYLPLCWYGCIGHGKVEVC